MVQDFDALEKELNAMKDQVRQLCMLIHIIRKLIHMLIKVITDPGADHVLTCDPHAGVAMRLDMRVGMQFDPSIFDELRALEEEMGILTTENSNLKSVLHLPADANGAKRQHEKPVCRRCLMMMILSCSKLNPVVRCTGGNKVLFGRCRRS